MNHKLLVLLILLLEPALIAELITPSDGDTTYSTYIKFQWTQIPYAHSYQLVAAEDSMFENVRLEIIDTTLTYIDRQTFDWNESIYWTVYPLDEVGDLIEPLPPCLFFTGEKKLIETNISIYDSNSFTGGITLFSSWLDEFSCAIDENGLEIWNDGGLEIMLNYVDEYGQMFGSDGKQFNIGHDLVWQQLPGTLLNRHDLRTMLNGNIYGLRPVQELGPIPLGWWTEYYQSLGYEADGVTNEYLWTGEKISVIDRDSKDEIWAWNPFDYYSMDDVDSLGNTWWWNNIPTYDWLHTNSIFFNDDDSAFYVSHRHISRISKISYPSGELIWMMGLPEPYMASGDQHLCNDLLFSWQHDAEILENGNIIFFDNGIFSETLLGLSNPVSRIIEVSVTEDDSCDVVWIYDLPDNLYSQGMGSVQELPNGNLQISTMGNGGTILEINRDKEIIWEANLNLGEPNGSLYRAYRVESLFPQNYSIMLDDFIYLEPEIANLPGINLNQGEPVEVNIFNEGQQELSLLLEIYVFDNDSLSSISEPIEDNIQPNEFINLVIPIDHLPEGLYNLVLNSVPYPYYQDGQFIEFNINVSSPISIQNESSHLSFQLKNYPNPFNPSTTLRYDLPEDAIVNITIYDIMGKRVSNLVSSRQSAGYKSVQWNATNSAGQPVSAGLYLYTIEAGEFRQTKKMVLLK
jgi:hypothetical protein